MSVLTKNQSTYFYILIILLLFIILYYSSSRGKISMDFLKKLFDNGKEKDKQESEDDKIEILENVKPQQYETDIEMINSVYNKNGPILTKENQTQFDFKKLIENLNKINRRKIVKLKGATNYQSYTQSTTRDRLRMDLDQITKQIIPLLNSKTYEFAKTNYGDVEVWTDKENNEEIKYELFLWDQKNFFEIKFLVHVVKFVDQKYAGKYGVKKSPYLFPTYFIGYPCEDQLIPTPDEVIPSGNISNYPKGVCTNDPLPIKYLYVNRVEIWNSTLVVNYGKNMYPHPMIKISENPLQGMGGVTDMKLDFIRVKGDRNPIFKKAKKYNQWIRLDEEPKWEGQYPCKEPPFNKWNEEGIYYYEKGQGAIPKDVCPKLCAGTRWSSMGEPLQPNFWVNNYQAQPCGENFWLFDNARGLPGVFFGGGKK